MKYRKKPVIVEAIRYNGMGTMFNAPEWLANAYRHGVIYFKKNNPNLCFIKTLEGDHYMCIGDFIIRGVEGELYPCKPDIFNKTYEKVND